MLHRESIACQTSLAACQEQIPTDTRSNQNAWYSAPDRVVPEGRALIRLVCLWSIIVSPSLLNWVSGS